MTFLNSEKGNLELINQNLNYFWSIPNVLSYKYFWASNHLIRLSGGAKIFSFCSCFRSVHCGLVHNNRALSHMKSHLNSSVSEVTRLNFLKFIKVRKSQKEIVLSLNTSKNQQKWVKKNQKQRHGIKVHIFWEGHKILRNLPLTFDCMYCSQK